MSVHQRQPRAASRRSLKEESADSDVEMLPLQSDQRSNKRKRLSSPEPVSDVDMPELDDEDFEIDYIVDSRFRTYARKAVLEYFIHWKGYPVEERSWTLADQLEDDDPPVLAFYKKYPNKPRRNQRTVLSLMGNQARQQQSAPSQKVSVVKSGKPKTTPAPVGSKTVTNVAALGTTAKAPAQDTPPLKKRVRVDSEEDVVTSDSSSKAAESRKGRVEVESDEEFVIIDESSDDAGEVSDDDEGSIVAETEDSEPEVAVKPRSKIQSTSKTEPPRKTMNGGWGVRIKGPKKPAVKLGSFATGVLPLPIKVDVKSKNANDELPPINDIEAIFDHLTSRLPASAEIAQRLGGRKLRVATMCSGTESPLLALDLIAKSIRAQYGVALGIEHVFSCEIEPFKQAYIERNFAPPILFRDVTELGRKKAHTAYGSLVDVPGDVDMLIAGTSCVDYSGLNNEKQDIEANGESGRTFRGMLQWVNKHRPPIVILENVCSAPWDKVVEYFGQIDYDAQYLRLDTKEYYIPHTRTRVYLLATPLTSDSPKHLPEKWAATVKDLRRPWSSSFEAFLLPDDNVNIHRARLDLAAAKFHKDGTTRKATDWGRCESRHARARQEEGLGNLRPLTAWQEAGVCRGLDWTWNDWLLAQTERVLDLLEISTLRMAKDGVDSGYKACIWNVSQNVDRQTGSSRTALAPCLTPNMIPWVTNRGGPVTGREALALQGIPVEDLLLTSESEDQLADLAGNAMTTTVVGASMLAALHVAVKLLTKGGQPNTAAAEERSQPDISESRQSTPITGVERLCPHSLDLAKVSSASLEKVLDMAGHSSRHCVCEGQSGTATSPISECRACGYRSCQACGGRPEHEYVACHSPRVEPAEFGKYFKELLPMRVRFAGVTAKSLESSRREAAASAKDQIVDAEWQLWSQSVLDSVSDAEFRFRHLKRQNVWTATYEAPSATLELHLRKPVPEWRVSIQAPATEPVNSRLRSLLKHPVARSRVDPAAHDLLSGSWELCLPSKLTFDANVTGEGDLVPSWQATLGLPCDDETRWSKLRIDIDPTMDDMLDRPLAGVYTLLPKCGQAMSSLHVKDISEPNLPPLYFFMDPSRYGEASEDRFVFSASIDRLDFNMERDIVASFTPKWRESSRSQSSVKVIVDGKWTASKSINLTAVTGGALAVDDETAHRDEATYSTPSSHGDVATANATCAAASALLAVKVPLDPARAESMWGRDDWNSIDVSHHSVTTFADLAWITERLPPLDTFSDWSPLTDVEEAGVSCIHCAPQPPTIHWIKQPGKLNKKGGKTKSTIIAFEDRLEAGRYEHALKNRPAPFAVQLRLSDGYGYLQIGLNATSLAHRALARLPKNASKGLVRLSWRLTPGQVADVPEPPRVFIMPSNKKDPEHSQPSSFLLPLRKEQLRSLWWMLHQERTEEYTFVEEEISEALLPSLGWRAEGKAERPVMVRGGVIADQVGYGKTIISLALIAEAKQVNAPPPTPAPAGSIDLKATLIVVPGHLSRQWPNEIRRFTGSLFKTVVIQTHQDLANKSIADLKKADIIVVAAELFDSDAYWQRCEYLSAQPEDWLGDANGGRLFANRLDTALQTLADQTALLKSQGSAAALTNMRLLQKRAVADLESKKDAMRAANFGKRLKGSAYRDKYDDSTTNTNTASRTNPWEAVDESDNEDETAIPAPSFRKASGTLGLNSSSVEKNFELLAGPVLHMFRFRRVIADEFTYLDKRALAALLRLSSCFKWVLSGTPPVNDFSAIRSIATFMGLHLGGVDDSEGSVQAQKARAKEQTAAEKFHAFRESHSMAWHRRRDDLAQEFLNTFVRQNIAEIDDIPAEEHIHTFKLPASEGAVYLELEHHLQALEMQARKETKFKNVTQGDRNARLEEALADSKTAEEALLKRCCHFTLDLTDKKRDAKSATEACEHISTARRKQLEGCEEDLRRTVNLAVGMHCYIRKKGDFGASDPDANPFREWVKNAFDSDQHQGDAEAAHRLVAVLEGCDIKAATIPDNPADGKPAKVEAKAKVADVKWTLREQTHLLRRLSKELVARVRSLRFFEVVRKLQHNGEEAVEVLEHSACCHRPSQDPDVEMAVLSCCGHVSCHACMIQAVGRQRCVQGVKCHAAVRPTNIVKVSTLGIEGELSSGRFGAKLQRLVNLIRSIPSRERVLVFNQWEDLNGKISEALAAGGINHVTLTGTVKRRANTLDRFQTLNSDEDVDAAQVLLLKVNDASAAGSNLTTANHVIFLGPLFTSNLLDYRATETQAIGRIRRFGQQRVVHIHRLLALDTIDMTIFQSRSAELQAKPDYMDIPRTEYIPKKRKTAL